MENKKISPKEFEKMSGEEVDKKITEEIKDKEISAPLKFNPGAQKYEPDMEKLNEKVEDEQKTGNFLTNSSKRGRVEEINKKIENRNVEKIIPENKKAEGSFTL